MGVGGDLVRIANWHLFSFSVNYNCLFSFFFSEKYTRFCQWKNLELNIQVSIPCIIIPRGLKPLVKSYFIVIWASTQENLSSVVCEQQRRRPACATTQSDQRLCYLLFEKYHIKACYKQNFNFLASPCS